MPAVKKITKQQLPEALKHILNKQVLVDTDFTNIVTILQAGVKAFSGDFSLLQNEEHWPALSVAAGYGNVECVQAILNIQNEAQNTVSNAAIRKYFAVHSLHVAIAHGHEECVAIILRNNPKEYFYERADNIENIRNFRTDGFTADDLKTAGIEAIRVCATGCLREIINFEIEAGIKIAKLALENCIYIALEFMQQQGKYTRDNIDAYCTIIDILQGYMVRLYPESKTQLTYIDCTKSPSSSSFYKDLETVNLEKHETPNNESSIKTLRPRMV